MVIFWIVNFLFKAVKTIAEKIWARFGLVDVLSNDEGCCFLFFFFSSNHCCLLVAGNAYKADYSQQEKRFGISEEGSWRKRESADDTDGLWTVYVNAIFSLLIPVVYA